MFDRNPSNDYYMYTWNDVYWFISRRVGDDSFLLAMITANSACPNGDFLKTIYVLTRYICKCMWINLKLTFFKLSDNSLFLVRTGPGQNDHSVTSKIVVTET